MIVARLLYAALALSLLGSIPRGTSARRAPEGCGEPAVSERSAKDAWKGRPQAAPRAPTNRF